MSSRTALGAACIGLVVGCGTDPVVPLIQLTEVAPRQVELGDKLEIAGSAFPQGRKARVLFDGALHRPGEPVEPDSEVEAEGEVTAPDRIVVSVNESLLASFCGAGSAAAHTTFEGTVTVIFAAQTAGAPPVSGILERTTVDILPTAASQARFLADTEDGTKLLHASGLRVEPRPGGGLTIASVDDGSRAMRAGLLPDDVIVSAGGVRTSSVADLAPNPELASLPLSIHRGGNTAEEVHELAVDSAARSTPRRFALPAAIVGAMALLIALLAASPGRRFAWLRRRLASRDAALPSSIDRAVTAAALVTVSALPLALPSADAGLLALAAWSGALATSLLLGGEGTSSSWRAALLVACRIGPAMVCWVMALAVVGSLRADEIVAAQGGAPWSFFAARSPAHAALACVFCSWAILRATDHADAATINPLARSAERYVAVLHAALAVTLFFGGWRIPWVTLHPRGLLLIPSAAAFVAKTAALSFVLDRLGAALPPRSLRAVARTSWTRLVPIALLAGVGAAFWESRVTSRGVAAAVTFAIVALAAGAALQLGWPLRRDARVPADPIA